MKDLREYFHLRPEVIYLNHGSFGACPKPVFEKYQQWQAELERQPVEFLGRRFPDLMLEARQALATFLNVHHDDLVFVPNATTGINIVARSLRLGQGDEVLTTNLEYGAADRTWEFVCRKRNARLVRSKISLPIESPEEVIDAVWRRVTENTRVLFLSHITAVTALTLPVAELIHLAKDAGVTTVIDGAHAPGQLDLDLDALGADFYTGNCHKWLMAPKGAAFLYARPEVQSLVEPLIVSWGDVSRGESRFVQENEWQGTRDIAAYLSVPAAIQFRRDHDWPTVQDRCYRLAAHARGMLADVTGLAPLCPDNNRWFRQMVAHPLPRCDSQELKRRLYDEHKIEIPINVQNNVSYIRVSVQGYNTAPDVDALSRAISNLLPECRR